MFIVIDNEFNRANYPDLINKSFSNPPSYATVKQLDDIELVASGYEWYCPKCNEMNNIPEVTEIVTCEKCNQLYATGYYHHVID